MTPQIQADGLRLMPYGPEHDAQTVEWLNDPATQQGFGMSRSLTIASHRAWCDAHGDILMWAIVEDDGCHCGNVLLHPEPARRSAYLQVYVGRPQSRQRGVAFRALRGALTFAFRTLHVHRIWLHTLPDNLAAERLYVKLGFTREGVEREALPRGNGFIDQTRWSLLEQEWTAGPEGRPK